MCESCDAPVADADLVYSDGVWVCADCRARFVAEYPEG